MVRVVNLKYRGSFSVGLTLLLGSFLLGEVYLRAKSETIILMDKYKLDFISYVIYTVLTIKLIAVFQPFYIVMVL